jgi:predicted hydrocarbon binding protein
MITASSKDDLPVSVVVDSDTGSWSVNGQPMVLVPRHFLVFTQMEFENEIGVEATRRVIEAGTYRAAKTWCRREAARNAMKGPDILQHYLEQVKGRGLGKYEIVSIDLTSGEASIRLFGSIYAAEYGPKTGRATCYMSAASCRGGMEVVMESLGNSVDLCCEEISCASDGKKFCEFKVFPARERQGK